MMLRMVLVGLLIPLGVGVLTAMELRTPPRAAATVVQPLAETTVGISDSRDALAKADRLEVTYAKSETPTQPDPVDERIAPSEPATIGSPETPKIINRHRHDPKPKKVATAALPKAKPKPRTTDIKRAAIPALSKAVSAIEPCRLSAFGGLRKALNLSGCEI
jgi:outer membrane biosynthesis protein TonB